ncbi:MAG TPA: spherulation-specific family 4 protein [Verrucomicrobiae bacterium]|nr:spherulation-specific family 4 protein [Verrucomicrobiae bacterium]
MRRLLVLCLGAALAAGCGASQSAAGSAGGAIPERSSSGAAPTGIVVPLYAGPGPQWNEVVAQKKAHPIVPIVIIANVDNGPGSPVYSSYAAAIEKAQAAGIVVLGYVYTSYGTRSPATIEAQMTRWSTFYKVDGAFLDEMNPSDPQLYRNVTAYAHAHSLPLVMGNPGENAPGNAGPDVINDYEQRGYPSLAFLKQPSHLAYGKRRWSYMAGAVPLRSATIAASVPYVAYLYATDGAEPECYCKLPTYFPQLVALLAALDAK